MVPAAFCRWLINATVLWCFSLPSFCNPTAASFSSPPGQQEGFDGGFSPRLELGTKPGLTFAAQCTWLGVFHQDSFILNNNTERSLSGFGELL